MLPLKDHSRRKTNSVIRKLEHLINEQLDQSSLSSEEICHQIGISRSQLHRIVKKESQLSLTHYIRQKRLERAKTLLRGTDLLISEVSDSVGIGNHQNFAKYFKSLFGVSPSQYRSDNKTDEASNLNTLAVLPFVNFSTDKDQEYFSDGITEEIINILAQVPALKIVGRSSSFAYKNKVNDLRDVGRTLDVNYIIEGSVRKYHDKIRITAKLAQTQSGIYIWSNKYDRDITDIFKIQDDIAESILEVVKKEILSDQDYKIIRRANRDPIAHENYLKGLHLLNKYSNTQNFEKAIAFFDRALAIEPDYIECSSEIASCHVQLWFFSQADKEKSIERAIQILNKISAIEPNNASVLTRQAHIEIWYNWDMKKAIKLLDKALSINSSNVEALLHLCCALCYDGQYDKAQQTIAKAIKIDPLSGILRYGQAFAHWYSGYFDRAMVVIDNLLAFLPEFWGGHYLKAVMLTETYRAQEALKYAQRAIDLFPNTMNYALLAQVYLLCGNFEKNKEIIENIERQKNRFPTSNFDLGHLYMSRGEFKKSHNYFQKALDAKEGRMLLLLPLCRKIKILHNNPLFKPFFDHMRMVTSDKPLLQS